MKVQLNKIVTTLAPQNARGCHGYGTMFTYTSTLKRFECLALYTSKKDLHYIYLPQQLFGLTKYFGHEILYVSASLNLTKKASNEVSLYVDEAI